MTLPKLLCLSSAVGLCIGGCTSTTPPPAPAPLPPNVAEQHASAPPSRLTVGTSYPDTQLILPWFLNDVINLVNYR